MIMLRPTGNKILVRMDDPPAQTGLIFIPESCRENPNTGRVVSIGAGPFPHSPCAAGDRVRLRNSICGHVVMVGSELHRLVFDGDVIGRIVK